jgi:hypothetical protein
VAGLCELKEGPGDSHREITPGGGSCGGSGHGLDPKGGDHHNGVPIYILNRNPAPAWAADWPLVHFVSNLETAVRETNRTAGDRNVLVHGARIAPRALIAGLLDEL